MTIRPFTSKEQPFEINHVVGIADRAHQKNDATTKLVFFFCTCKKHEKVLSADIDVDGINATQTIISTLEPYKDQFQLIFLKGLEMGGLNIIDIDAVHKALGRPVIVITEQEPPSLSYTIYEELKQAPGKREHLANLEKAGEAIYYYRPRSNNGGVFYCMRGIDEYHAQQCLKKFLAKDHMETLPECLVFARKAADGS